jgi:predicted transcriptional regulator
MAGSPPEKDLLQAILLKFNDNFVTMTLADAYNTIARPNHGWSEFVSAINHLKSEGMLEGKGDGFAVLYSLTRKGQAMISAKS